MLSDSPFISGESGGAVLSTARSRGDRRYRRNARVTTDLPTFARLFERIQAGTTRGCRNRMNFCRRPAEEMQIEDRYPIRRWQEKKKKNKKKKTTTKTKSSWGLLLPGSIDRSCLISLAFALLSASSSIRAFFIPSFGAFSFIDSRMST